MKNNCCKISLFAFAIFTSASANAEPQDFTSAYVKCASTRDDRQRLACFDALTATIVKQNSPPSTNKNSYLSMSLIDLKTDIKSLTGKKVTVPGYIQMVGEMAFIKGELVDMTPITINIEQLPREDRKRAIQGCISTLCGATISGTVRNDGFTARIDVDRVVWQ